MKRFLALTSFALILATGAACSTGPATATSSTSGNWPPASEAAFRSSFESNYRTSSGGSVPSQTLENCTLGVAEDRWATAAEADAAAVKPGELGAFAKAVADKCGT